MRKKQRRRYEASFKQEALRLVDDPIKLTLKSNASLACLVAP